MTTRDVVLTALREAASIGIADIEAGRFTSFDSEAAIDQHLAGLVGTGNDAMP